MNKSTTRGKREYLLRDKGIVAQLRSEDDDERNIGVLQLDGAIYIPFAIVLTRIARGSSSEAFERVLGPDSNLDPHEFDDVWQGAVTVLLEEIKKPDFELTHGLLAFMLTIAIRQLARRWRKERKIDPDTDPDALTEDHDWTPADEDPELQHDIEAFFEELDEDGMVAIQIGMRLATDEYRCRKKSAVLADKIRRSSAWGGSDKTITRRYDRLRARLGKYLKGLGYDV